MPTSKGINAMDKIIVEIKQTPNAAGGSVDVVAKNSYPRKEGWEETRISFLRHRFFNVESMARMFGAKKAAEEYRRLKDLVVAQEFAEKIKSHFRVADDAGVEIIFDASIF